jgi:hypothetical protein
MESADSSAACCAAGPRRGQAPPHRAREAQDPRRQNRPLRAAAAHHFESTSEPAVTGCLARGREHEVTRLRVRRRRLALAAPAVAIGSRGQRRRRRRCGGHGADQPSAATGPVLMTGPASSPGRRPCWTMRPRSCRRAPGQRCRPGCCWPRAEVDQLARAPERAEASLHAVLRIYTDRHATPLEHQAAAALAGLTGHPSAKPALPAPATKGPESGDRCPLREHRCIGGKDPAVKNRQGDMRRMSKPPALRVFTLRTDTAWVGEGFPLAEVPF